MFKNILRILVGLVFIASGFVKSIDVVGFSFKMEEYFSASVF
ncbi:MAG: DoxX family protein, partial [Chryseobacterium sp.]|nr:DoxX family protein [Chryseobacterium sp.]